MKAQINIIELITVLIAIFIAFGVLFSRFSYKNKWGEASLIIASRDLILTMDRIGKLYNYSFGIEPLSSFLDKFPSLNKTNLIAWSETRGALPQYVIVACNCTQQQINEMNFWYSRLKINDRSIILIFLQSSLENIPTETDVLLIRDYKNLSKYYNNFRDYLSRGIGIVEMMDFSNEDEVNGDEVQKKIFGLNFTDVYPDAISYSNLTIPEKSSDITYQPYKNFYHVPLPILNSSSENLPDCKYKPSAKGNITINNINYTFWICDESTVWFDTDGDGLNDTKASLGETLEINGYNFTLSYINGNESIAISFRPKFTFSDFLSKGGNVVLIQPNDGNEKRVLVKAVGSREYPAAILNTVFGSRAAWIPNFDRRSVNDEEKELLLSLLLWASKKEVKQIGGVIKSGLSSSYINVKNKDIYEVYSFSLILAHPY
jgi:hypothetical protein